VAIQPNAENLERYGWSLFLTGDLKGAEAHLRRALEAEPNRLEALFRLGGVLMKQGRTAEGRHALQQVAQRALQGG
jgi:Flp pilus assembly protein TadD